MNEPILKTSPGAGTHAVAEGQRSHLTFKGNIRTGRHGWLRLTPAYSLHVVREILQECGEHEIVLDPFSGTGTTPLAASALGIKAHAVDINPFLVWLGNLKMTLYKPSTAEALRDEAQHIVTRLQRRKQWDGAWVPNLHQIEKWWDRPILEGLSQLAAAVKRVENAEVASLLRVAFCRAAIETAHVSFGHQSMSFKRPGQQHQAPLFDAMELTNARGALWRRFLSVVEEIAGGLLTDQPRAHTEVFLGDARDLESVLPSRHYTRVITSPPYPNRMSYIRELRPYMYWLGFLENGREAGEMDWQAIGGTWGCATSNLATWSPDCDPIPYPRFAKIISAIEKDHKLLARYVHKYFLDIREHLRSLRNVMATGGRCYYVVGNSKFYGTMLPVEEIYAALFEDCGFKNARIQRLRKRTSKKELYEFIVYAEVSPPSSS